MAWYFTFFFISGLCGIVYELVWLRLAMAQFGVTTALTSIVLSMFMAGLGLGSWAAGSLVRAYGKRIKIHPLETVRCDRIADRLLRARGSSATFLRTSPAGSNGSAGGGVVGCVLSGFRRMAGVDAGALVRVHGRDDSVCDVCDSHRSGQRIAAVF